MKQKTIFKNFGNIRYQSRNGWWVQEWLIYRHWPHIGRSLI